LTDKDKACLVFVLRNVTPFTIVEGELRMAKFPNSGVRVRLAMCVGLLVGVDSTTAAIPTSERNMLIALYTSTNGDSWDDAINWCQLATCMTNVDGFTSAGSECQWHGVTCDAIESHVVKIDLRGNTLSGRLPPITALTEIQYVDFSDNSIGGEIPSLTGLTHLQEFDVYYNQLNGPLPSIAGLSELRSLQVHGNLLTGSIPKLSGSTHMSYFQAQGNHLDGSIPTLQGLTSLTLFNVSQNELTGSIPPIVGSTILFSFNARANRLTGSIPALTGLTHLAELDVSQNRLTGPIPSLVGLKNLSFLRIGANHLNGAIPSVPEPSVVEAGESTLCPNLLNLAPSVNDSAWDIATGAAPWWGRFNSRCDILFRSDFEE
jgi:hypothetical protein